MNLDVLGDKITGQVVLPPDDRWEAARQAWNLAVDQRRSRSSIPRRPTTSPRPFGPPPSWASVSPSTPAATTRARSTGRRRPSCSRPSGCTASRSTRPVVAHGSRRAPVATARRRRGRPWPRLPRGHFPERRRRWATPSAAASAGWFAPRARLQQHRRGGRRDRRRVAAHGRPRPRARAVLGDPRRRRQRGGRHGDRARAVPVPELYAGTLFWPIERAAEVLHAWRGWVDRPRDLHLPGPHAAAARRARSCPSTCAAGPSSWSRRPPRDRGGGRGLVEPLRELGPAIDTMAMLPASELSTVNMDPEDPLPYSGEGILLDDFPTGAIEPLVDAFVGSPLLHVESAISAARPLVVAGPWRPRRDRSAVPRLHVRADPRCRDARRRRPPGRPRPRRPPAVGQRAALPQLRRVTHGSAVDLPGRHVERLQAAKPAMTRPAASREPRDRGTRPGAL